MHNDTAKIIITVITTGIAIIFGLGGWMCMSISEVRADIRDIRSDIRDIRSDMRENRAIAKADSDKNSAQLAAHLSAHATPESRIISPPPKRGFFLPNLTQGDRYENHDNQHWRRRYFLLR